MTRPLMVMGIWVLTAAIATGALPALARPVPALVNVGVVADQDVCLRMAAKPIYFEQKLFGALPGVFVRAEVLEKLKIAAASLPEGYSLLITDGYRTRLTQQHLYVRTYEKILRDKRADFWSERKITRKLDRLVLEYVADPQGQDEETPPHLTGGAVDLTLLFRGQAVAMGTELDQPSPLSSASAFSEPRNALQREYQGNRIILIRAMKEAGFANDPAEWWHWEYGTRLWIRDQGLVGKILPYEAIEDCSAEFNSSPLTN